MKRILSTLAGCVMACAAAQAQVVLITSAAPEGASYLKVDSRAEALQFEATAAETAVGVTTNLNYSLTAADSWCTATRTATGFTVSVAANTGAAARTTTLRLNALDNNSHTYTVSQLGSEPAILVGAKTVTLEDNATHFTIDVKSNTEVTLSKRPTFFTPLSVTNKGWCLFSFFITTGRPSRPFSTNSGSLYGRSGNAAQKEN